ncbi:hypothetical protein GXW82_03820 [Streptacidiphilus sp. 4-A2]|nr:hypothetical protein [Streptacidiphilus sp. 4-A2]
MGTDPPSGEVVAAAALAGSTPPSPSETATASAAVAAVHALTPLDRPAA